MPEEVHVRTFPCYCKNCLEERYLACENREFAGDFELQVLRKKGERTPGTRFNEEARTSILNGREVEVEKIVGSWYVEGRYEYEIVEERTGATMWIDADKLKCYEMMEQYEINSNWKKKSARNWVQLHIVILNSGLFL